MSTEHIADRTAHQGAAQAEAPADGLVIVDKPADWTSHDVVGRLRRLAHTRKVGHAGTLDPMATGVLVLGVNKATRLLHYLALHDKAYTATIRLGAASSTDDAQGEIIPMASAQSLTEDAVHAALAPLRGDIVQRPSSVSAIKVDGQRAYKLAREGAAVELAARPVTVSRLDACGFTRAGEQGQFLDVRVLVECSSGTYVRALARDLGQALSVAGQPVGGHLTALRRTRVGPFTLAQAYTLEQLAELGDPVTLPLAVAVRTALGARELTAEQATALSYGKAVEAAGITGTYGAFAPGGELVALLAETGTTAKPQVVFRPA